MVTQAVILAAGFGSRLARSDADMKPLREVGGATLIHRNLQLLERAGIERVVVVIGYQSEVLRASVERDAKDSRLELIFAHNEEYAKGNGISVLKARPHIDGDYLLLMADHIFDPAIAALAVSLEPGEGAVLCIDRKIDQVFDIDDATKVVTDGEHVQAIGKQLTDYNAIDTGMFTCSAALFDAIAAARVASDDDDASLSQGVATLLKRGTMRVADIGDAVWQDVDDPAMLAHAEKLLAARRLGS